MCHGFSFGFIASGLPDIRAPDTKAPDIKALGLSRK